MDGEPNPRVLLSAREAKRFDFRGWNPMERLDIRDRVKTDRPNIYKSSSTTFWDRQSQEIPRLGSSSTVDFQGYIGLSGLSFQRTGLFQIPEVPSFLEGRV